MFLKGGLVKSNTTVNLNYWVNESGLLRVSITGPEWLLFLLVFDLKAIPSNIHPISLKVLELTLKANTAARMSENINSTRTLAISYYLRSRNLLHLALSGRLLSFFFDRRRYHSLD